MSREKGGGSIFKHLLSLSFIIYSLGVFATLGAQKMTEEGLSPLDPSSFSRPELAAVKNISLSLKVNFERKIFTGFAVLTVEKLEDSVAEVILDSSDLTITEVFENDLKRTVKYTLSEPIPEYGSKLTIELPPKEKSVYSLKISYSTSAEASGLQWLTAEQTAGKKFPFVFSQFQAIHARSVIPCQDTPAVKAKYDAIIESPNNMVVLMSAIRKEYKDSGTSTFFHFQQEVPIPSYLIAIAIGALEARRIGPRSHVWSESELIEEAAYEFAETEAQLKAAEEICGPYVWGIYDLLVLPPSFPFGGMENPCLTFVTPTLLAGDRSLANVVAHEISHSWTGNLVTNRNFEHFWLNEGFTVFVERKIKGRLQGAAVQDFDAFIGVKELQETINEIGKDNPLTNLVVNLKNVHPDDAFSKVPYEKGHTFLRYLENLVGGPAQFEPFLRTYFNTYKFRSIETSDFRQFFENYFQEGAQLDEIDWDRWLYTPGMPPVIPFYITTLAQDCDALKEKWLQWNESEEIPFTFDDMNNFTTDQKIYLLQEIMESPPQSVEKLGKIEEVFQFRDVKNSEIRFRWLRICLKGRWEAKIDAVLEWVNEIGRMKFVRPLYRDLYEWELSRERAIENFKNNSKNMMHVTAYTVAKDLHLKE